MFTVRIGIIILFLTGLANVQAGEFVEHFDGRELRTDPAGRDGWAFMTGDGDSTMSFSQAAGIGRVEVDARADRRNIWWAFIRHSVSPHINVETLAEPGKELRVEARIRVSDAPRRVNLHFNHSRTVDFHSNLMEYDIPDTDNWHVISLTTRGFDALPDDEIFVQMALMDWGRNLHSVDVDYLRVSVVDPAVSGPDLGNPLPYRPQAPPLDSFVHAFAPAAEGIVDLAFPSASLRNWANRSEPSATPLLAVGGSLVTLLRWDLEAMTRCAPRGWGVLALTTDQVYRADTGLEEFGELRIVEILSGDTTWQRDTLTSRSFLAGETVDTVFNEQMVIDVPPETAPGGTTLITISPPVLQRLLNGRTKGLAIFGQGSLYATFGRGPKLYLNIEQPTGGCEEIMQ